MNRCTLPPPPLGYPDLPPVRLGDRAHFPQLEFGAYLAHAAISPASLALGRAVTRATSDLARFGAAAFPQYESQRERLRAGLAELLGVAARDLALTPGTTYGISDIAHSLPLGQRDEVVLLQGEFPANVLPWMVAAKAAGAKITLLPAPELKRVDFAERLVARVEERLRHGARYVAVSAVQFQTGLRMPTAELGMICRAHSAHLLVDGIQAVGPVPLHPTEEGMSALMGGAHKWLLGSEGAGYCYISEELRRELRPRTVGWLSYEDGARFLFDGPDHLRYDRPEKSGADVFEGSTSSLLSFVAMEAGVDLIRALGPEQIYTHIQGYHDVIEPRLERLGLRSLRASAPYRSGILSFQPPAGVVVKELALALRQRGVMVSTPDGLVRLAPHFGNALSEIDGVCVAFAEALAELGHPRG